MIWYQFQRFVWPSRGLFNVKCFQFQFWDVFLIREVFSLLGRVCLIPGSVLSPKKCFSILGSVPEVFCFHEPSY